MGRPGTPVLMRTPTESLPRSPRSTGRPKPHEPGTPSKSAKHGPKFKFRSDLDGQAGRDALSDPARTTSATSTTSAIAPTPTSPQASRLAWGGTRTRPGAWRAKTSAASSRVQPSPAAAVAAVGEELAEVAERDRALATSACSSPGRGRPAGRSPRRGRGRSGSCRRARGRTWPGCWRRAGRRSAGRPTCGTRCAGPGRRAGSATPAHSSASRKTGPPEPVVRVGASSAGSKK